MDNLGRHGQLAAHYSNCIKLSAENKISAKNAFSLQLIDCMAQMLRQKKSDLDNFQVASYTLDASAKIYGYRVEVLHGETLRMAGGLGRADNKQKTAEEGEPGFSFSGWSLADERDGQRFEEAGADLPPPPPAPPADLRHRFDINAVTASSWRSRLMTSLAEGGFDFDQRRLLAWAGPGTGAASADRSAAVHQAKAGHHEEVERGEDHAPEDLHYDIAAVFKLFLRPDIGIVREVASAADAQHDLDGSVADYDYDNERDSQNYCPDLPQTDDCDDYDQEATFLPSGGGASVWDASELQEAAPPPSATQLSGESLVQAPHKVEKIHIAYARTAKKMDMRKLKVAIWEILLDKKRDDKENASGSPPAVRKEAAADQMTPDRDYSFRELYHRLPARISTKMADNLSVALAFTALLHTANERCLRITGSHRLDDFLVSQEAP
ncbi:condensin complex subunit 2-like [Pollicipes pollicipes]|uniref:condensin complex subunit 2-like n=1 Tax=Pollicipes pollicipes TaxID=41117 RepID=UPI001884A97C|nr:condensin complex subunit 2-like [Pollicipes pollicipes]